MYYRQRPFGQPYRRLKNNEIATESELLSVTVICEDGALADYLSTTLYLMGKEAIPSYLDDARFSVIVIDNEQNVYVSSAIRDQFSIVAEGYTEVKE